jgi:hypothetical protein
MEIVISQINVYTIPTNVQNVERTPHYGMPFGWNDTQSPSISPIYTNTTTTNSSSPLT